MDTTNTSTAPAPAQPPAFDLSTAIAAAHWVPRSALERWARNPRKNDGNPVLKVARSIRRFGFVAPVVVWQSRGRIVAGDTRIKAWDRIVSEAERVVDGVIVSGPRFVPRGGPGPGLVPVRFHEFASEAEADAYAIADNRLNEEAGWDPALARVVIEDIKIGDPDGELLGATGLEDAEIKGYLTDDAPGGGAGEQPTGTDPGGGRYKAQFGVIIVCGSEDEQERIYNDLKARGYDCRVVVT